MSKKYAEQSVLVTASLVVVAVVALAAALIYTRAVMIPFVVALFIVALVAPIEDFQVKKLRLPRVVAVVVTLLVVLSVIALVSLFVYQSAQTIVSTAGEYSASFAYMANRALKPIESLYRDERSRPQPKPAASGDTGPEAAAPAPDKDTKPVEHKPDIFELYPVVTDSNKMTALDVKPRFAPALQEPNEAAVAAGEPNGLSKRELRIDTRQIVMDLRNYIFNIVSNAFGTIFGLTSGVLFVSVFVIFLLAGRNPYAEHSQVYRDVVQKVRRYVGTKVVVSAIVGLLVWLSLHKIGMELAGVFGVLTFLLNFIPSIGAIIATLLPIPIAVVEFGDSPSLIVLVIVIPTVIHNVMGNFIEPKLMGSGLDLHPVTILLALSFWGLLWGVVGMLLAAPITAALRIVLMQVETLRPVANLLAGDFTKPAKTLT
jgi:AI-2 transport protein TqsA